MGAFMFIPYLIVRMVLYLRTITLTIKLLLIPVVEPLAQTIIRFPLKMSIQRSGV